MFLNTNPIVLLILKRGATKRYYILFNHKKTQIITIHNAGYCKNTNVFFSKSKLLKKYTYI